MTVLASRDASTVEDTADEIARAVLLDLDRAEASAVVLNQLIDRARAHVNRREITKAQVTSWTHLSHGDDDREPSPRRTLPLDPGDFLSLTPAMTIERALAATGIEWATERDLALLLARADTSDLYRKLHRAHALASDLHRHLHRDSAGHGLRRDLASELDGGRNRVRDLASTLRRARSLDGERRALPCSDLDRARTATDGLACACDLASDLHDGLVRTLDRVNGLQRAVNRTSVAPKEQETCRRVIRPASRLTVAAAWLLPRGDRCRYGEEWRCELAELAAAGAGRWRQLKYAVRLLSRTGSLRLALAQRKRHRKGA
jgi:hypothetical protein